jgi:hypothetical protein
MAVRPDPIGTGYLLYLSGHLTSGHSRSVSCIRLDVFVTVINDFTDKAPHYVIQITVLNNDPTLHFLSSLAPVVTVKFRGPW